MLTDPGNHASVSMPIGRRSPIWRYCWPYRRPNQTGIAANGMKCGLFREPIGFQMKLLLDTRIWIWTHLEPWKISSEITKELGSPRK